MTLLHGRDKRVEATRQIHSLPTIVIHGAAVAHLVYMITIEVKRGIDIIVTVCEVLLPLCVGWIGEHDITLP